MRINIERFKITIHSSAEATKLRLDVNSTETGRTLLFATSVVQARSSQTFISSDHTDLFNGRSPAYKYRFIVCFIIKWALYKCTHDKE
jgi:hypothetical protein